MKTISVSSLTTKIQDGFYRYFMVELVCDALGRCSFIFYYGRFNSFSGFVPEYRSKHIGFDTKNYLVDLARKNGLIGCNF